MKILVNGIGNIGTTLLGVLNQFKDRLNISHIYALKNTIDSWKQIELEFLQNLGIEICTKDVHYPYTSISDIIDSVDYIFDCTANGFGLKNKSWYQSLANLKGCSAQGSEKNFGPPFMTGINENIARQEKYLQIVSCNTHSLVSLLKIFSGSNLDQLIEADFVIVRRCEDLGNHERLVTSNVVSRHLDPVLGTHHAVDAMDLYQSIGLTPSITSSDITTPSQLLHSIRFNIKVKPFMSVDPRADLLNRINSSPHVSTTSKFDSNVIFELGRRYGFMGRLYAHALIINNNLLIETNCIKGWAFVPQEGNTIISTVHAFLLQTQHPQADKIMAQLVEELMKPIW